MDDTVIVPATAVTTLSGTFTDIVAANIVGILGVLFFVAVVAFVTRWFKKSAKLKG